MASAMAELHSFHSLSRSAILPFTANVTTRINSSFLRSKTILSNCKLVARNGAIRSNKLVPKALPEALLFDCDGVLVDTERDGHRVCFNKAFEEQGVAVNWDVEFFGTILDTGIGKKRIANYFDAYGWPESVVSVSDSQREGFVAALHKRKTALFVEMVESGQLSLRPGVTTLIDEALAKGVKVAVCSTSLERAVTAIVRVLLGKERADAMKIFAGDIVSKKKPDPAVYRLAASTLNVRPEMCVVIEDSQIGLAAAKAAGMACIVTTSTYTEGEDFHNADAVFPCIGEPPNQNFDVSFARNLLLEKKLA